MMMAGLCNPAAANDEDLATERVPGREPLRPIRGRGCPPLPTNRAVPEPLPPTRDRLECLAANYVLGCLAGACATA